jgi:hypothetical protein
VPGTADASTVPDTISLPADSPLRRLAASAPTLVVLLRSFGCTFCREALADVAAVKPELDAAGVPIAFIHTESADDAAPWFAKYGLRDVTRISDPGRVLYRAFGLDRTSATAIVDPSVWVRGAACAVQHGFGVQDYETMRRQPGVFVIAGDRVLAAFRHRTPADRPDYRSLVGSVKTLVQ